MTPQERAEKAQQIFNDAAKQMSEECGYMIYPTLLPKLPNDQYLVVEPQIQLREIAGWQPEEHQIVKGEPGKAPTLQTVKK